MNDLTKEASRQTIGATFNEFLRKRKIRRRARQLNPDRPLTGKPKHYLTRYEGSRCDRINIQCRAIPDHICGVCYHGKDTSDACSRRDCPEREESRTGINPDKINRASDDYRRISDEVETDS